MANSNSTTLKTTSPSTLKDKIKVVLLHIFFDHLRLNYYFSFSSHWSKSKTILQCTIIDTFYKPSPNNPHPTRTAHPPHPYPPSSLLPSTSIITLKHPHMIQPPRLCCGFGAHVTTHFTVRIDPATRRMAETMHDEP